MPGFLFQSTQPSQAVTNKLWMRHIRCSISIHTALAGCDGGSRECSHCKRISIHTALAGCDVPVRACSPSILTFQSTQPSQAVTKKGWVPVRELTISIHTALAGCDDAVERLTHLPGISIHTALAGCDAGVVAAVRWFTKISIHTALAGCDVTKLFGRSPAGIFQSTQPSQAVTQRPNIVLWYFLFQSTQPSQAVTWSGPAG